MRPRRVLDIGVGYGKWGLLVREALDFIDGRFQRDEWKVTIDGIDAHRYDSPLLDWVYDDVRICDVLDVADKLAGYDLVLMGDVIEHFEKEDGMRLLTVLLAHNRNVLLTTPLFYFDQEMEDNPYERHRSHWTMADFRPWTFDYDVVGGFLVVVALAGRGADQPRPADTRASRIAYSLPLLRHRGAATRVVKALVRSVTSAPTGVGLQSEPEEPDPGM
jgi:Methyltransferase domain